MVLHRKGIALVWVILMSALLLVAIVSISIRLIPEKQILNARAHTERALSVAETGLAELIGKTRTETGTIEEHLQEGETYEISSSPYYDSGNPAVNTQYKAKIVSEGNGVYGFYSLGEVRDKNGNLLARKVVKVRYTGDLPPLDEYAIFTAGGIDAQNGTINGNIFANAFIDFKNATLNGDAFVHTTDVDIKNINGDIYTNQTQIPFPPLDLQKYKDLWKAFLNGTAPFDGSNPDYPNTSIPFMQLYLSQKFPGLNATGEAATLAQFESFFADLRSSMAIAPLTLRGYMDHLVYYVKPTNPNKKDITLTGALYQTPPYLEGTLIIDGNLTLAGGAVIGDPTDCWNTSILVNGTVDVGAGGATLYGLLYVLGTGKHGNDPVFSVKTTGGFTCVGSIVALGNVNLNSTQLSITWGENRIYMEELRDLMGDEIEFTLVPDPSSWVELPYDESLWE